MTITWKEIWMCVFDNQRGLKKWTSRKQTPWKDGTYILQRIQTWEADIWIGVGFVFEETRDFWKLYKLTIKREREQYELYRDDRDQHLLLVCLNFFFYYHMCFCITVWMILYLCLHKFTFAKYWMWLVACMHLDLEVLFQAWSYDNDMRIEYFERRYELLTLL